MNNPLVVICGPTATGKTEYALQLAHEKNGELVSVDSRQVYKYLNIGTGKDLPKDSKFEDRSTMFDLAENNYTIGYYVVNGIPLWLYDILSPDKRFSASEYAHIARAVVQNIWSRGKLPVVVGGTGFYIQTLINGLDTEGVPPNEPLRKQLNNNTVKELQQNLKQQNPERFNHMNNSDRNNPRRLIRAIEISQSERDFNNKPKPITTNVQYIYRSMPKETLYKQIDKRVEKRVKDGIVAEITSLIKMGYLWNSPGLATIGYKEWKPFFEKKQTLKQVVARWKLNEHNYAKHQETWFKKYKQNNRIF